MTAHSPDGILVLGSVGGRQVMTTTPPVDPTVGAGVVAPVGSLYLRDNGLIYTKIGAVNTAWSALSSGSILVWGNNSIAAAADTRFLYMGRDSSTAPTTAITGWRAPRAGRLRNFRARHNSAVGNGNSVVYDVRVNAVAQGLALVLATGAIGDASNLVASFAVPTGALLTVTATKALSIGAGGIDCQFACELTG